MPIPSRPAALCSPRSSERRPADRARPALAIVCLLLAACAGRGPSRLVPPGEGPQACEAGEAFAPAARYNAAAATDLPVNLFGRPETGWRVYGPLAAATIQTRCPIDSPGFARALAGFQAARGLQADGALTTETLLALKAVWQQSRPFLKIRAAGVCPPGAEREDLVALDPSETLGGKSVLLHPKALAALRRLTAAARQEVVDASAKDRLRVFSGYRDPVVDRERCVRDQNCQGVTRALCSAHRTGLAVDLDLGSAPGFGPDAAADANRLYLSQTPLYLWMVVNARRFGFVNYAFEPWHWEWAGDGS